MRAAVLAIGLRQESGKTHITKSVRCADSSRHLRRSGDGKRFPVRADEKLIAFLDLESAISPYTSCIDSRSTGKDSERILAQIVPADGLLEESRDDGPLF